MNPKCREIVAQALGVKKLNTQTFREKTQDLEKRLLKHKSLLRDQDPKAWAALGIEQRELRAAQSAAREMVHEAAKRKEVVALQAEASIRLTEAFERWVGTPLYGSDGKTTYSGAQAANQILDQGYGYQNALFGEYMGRVAPVVNYIAEKARGFGGWRYDNEMINDLIYAAWDEKRPQRAANPEAKAAAQSLMDTREALRARFNLNGGDIGHLGYPHLPQVWDEHKLAGQKARQAFIDELMSVHNGKPTLMRNRYLDKDGNLMTDQRLREFLTQAWETIQSGGLNKLTPGEQTGVAAISSRRKYQREIHLNGPEAYIRVMARWGKGHFPAMMVNDIRRMTAEIGAMEQFGPNAAYTLRKLIDLAQIHDGETRGLGIKLPLKNNTQGGLLVAEDLAQKILGRGLYGPRPLWQRAFQSFSNLMVPLKLGVLPLSQITDLVTMFQSARLHKMAFGKILRSIPKFFRLRGIDQKQQIRFYNAAGLMNHAFIERVMGSEEMNSVLGFTGRLADNTMNLTGANQMTDSMRHAQGAGYMYTLAEKTRLNYAELPDFDQAWLSERGISEQHWQAWHLAQPTVFEGNAVLHPDDIARLTDAEIDSLVKDKIQALQQQINDQESALIARSAKLSNAQARRQMNFLIAIGNAKKLLNNMKLKREERRAQLRQRLEAAGEEKILQAQRFLQLDEEILRAREELLEKRLEQAASVADNESQALLAGQQQTLLQTVEKAQALNQAQLQHQIERLTGKLSQLTAQQQALSKKAIRAELEGALSQQPGFAVLKALRGQRKRFSKAELIATFGDGAQALWKQLPQDLILNDVTTEKRGKAVNPARDSLLEAVAKLGGLDIEQAKAEGLDPQDLQVKPFGIMRAFTRQGRSFDDLSLTLKELGYLPKEGGNALLERVDRELRGDKVYTPEGLIAQAERQALEEALAAQEYERGQQLEDDYYQDADGPFSLIERQMTDLAAQANAFVPGAGDQILISGEDAGHRDETIMQHLKEFIHEQNRAQGLEKTETAKASVAQANSPPSAGSGSAASSVVPLASAARAHGFTSAQQLIEHLAHPALKSLNQTLKARVQEIQGQRLSATDLSKLTRKGLLTREKIKIYEQVLEKGAGAPVTQELRTRILDNTTKLSRRYRAVGEKYGKTERRLETEIKAIQTRIQRAYDEILPLENELDKAIKKKIGAHERKGLSEIKTAKKYLDEKLLAQEQKLLAYLKDARLRQQKLQERIDALGPKFDQEMGNLRQRTRNQAVTQYLNLVREEVDTALTSPSLFASALSRGGASRGSIAGEFWYMAFMFKSFTASLMDRQLKRVRFISRTQGKAAALQYTATLFVGLTLLGAVSLLLRDLINGRDPSVMDLTESEGRKFWINAILRGQGTGILADLLYTGLGGTSRSGTPNYERQLGPGLGVVNETTGAVNNLRKIIQFSFSDDPKAQKAKRVAERDLIKFAARNTPYLNVWYLKGLFDHLVWNQLIEAVTPGYLEKERQRIQKEYGQDVFVKPLDVLPYRAPHLGNIFGDDAGQKGHRKP